MLSRFVITFLPRRKCFFNFMAAVTICNDFGAQENKIHHRFTFPLLLRVPKVKCVFRFTAGLRGQGTDCPCSPPPVSTPGRWSVVTAGEPAWTRPCRRVPGPPRVTLADVCPQGVVRCCCFSAPKAPHVVPPRSTRPPPRPRAPLVSLWLHSFVFSRASSCWPHTACHRLRLPPLSVMVIRDYRDVLGAWVSCERLRLAPQGYSGRGACPVGPAGFSRAGSWWTLLAVSSEPQAPVSRSCTQGSSCFQQSVSFRRLLVSVLRESAC